MIIDARNKIGYFDKEDKFNNFGLIEYNFKLNQRKDFLHFKDYKFLDISLDKKYFALVSDWFPKNGTNKTELIIFNTQTEQIEYSTKNYLVYLVKFNKDSTKLLFDIYGKKLFCLDLVGKNVFSQLTKSIRIHTGDFDIATDTFYSPLETRNGVFYIFDFNNGNFIEQNLKISQSIEKIKFSFDFKKIYFTTKDDCLYCMDREFKIMWKTDFLNIGMGIKQISTTNIFSSEDGNKLCISTPSTEKNRWGSEIIIDSTNGNIIKEIDNYQGRGIISSDFFENKLLTYKGTTLDIETNNVSENIIF